MKSDLHSHSTASDGSLEPKQVLAHAEQAGLELFALTDHDTAEGYRQLQHCETDLILLSGIEFSAQWRKRSVHVVGLGMNVEHPVFLQAEKAQADRRRERAEIIQDKFTRLGFADLLSGTESLPAAQLGRPLFAKTMVQRGWVKDEKQAFAKYLGAGKPGDITITWPELDEVIAWIKQTGGVAVLAHPGQYGFTLSKLRELLVLFKQAGGDALEVVSGPTEPQKIRDFANLCQRFELYASCGSDFHSPQMPWRQLGKSPDLPVSCRPVWQAAELQALL